MTFPCVEKTGPGPPNYCNLTLRESRNYFDSSLTRPTYLGIVSRTPFRVFTLGLSLQNPRFYPPISFSFTPFSVPVLSSNFERFIMTSTLKFLHPIPEIDCLFPVVLGFTPWVSVPHSLYLVRPPRRPSRSFPLRHYPPRTDFTTILVYVV